MMTFYINRGRSDRFAQTWPDATVRWKRRQRIAIVAAAGQRESGGGQWWIDAAVKSQRAGRAETNFGYKFHVHLFGRTIAWRSDHSLRTRRPPPLPRLWHTYEFGLIAFGKKKKKTKSPSTSPTIPRYFRFVLSPAPSVQRRIRHAMWRGEVKKKGEQSPTLRGGEVLNKHRAPQMSNAFICFNTHQYSSSYNIRYLSILLIF